ncbi:uncharacterized protein LAESUDRAFT_692951 [Laetiporus sulphureus 93-53]|uniref:Rds1 protein n=1 Tax=Laetiporus sulphureus 93-53 TaxID=1314785 RepID=A0A165GR72_9APHY|nr:uncharacterized protein LAESUDRAFT_692951 [Laetiporus sulphureus 93-53]KZT10694.1 hypothetical protein LAESUDRAFT_692951 [Laetiporus sulphureus 93-53]
MYSILLVLAAGALIAAAAPYSPPGGLDVNNTNPIYQPLSDFDYQSLNLALHQEYIELDLFHHGLATFSVEDFEEAGLNAADRFLIEFMADQELGHAIMISNMLGPKNASKECTYSYPFQTVRQFVEFCEAVTRFGESGTYGFIEHLNSRAAAQLLLEAVTTEARQQMVFRQFEGIFPMPFWFTPAVTQSMQWTLMAPYLTACPAKNTRIQFQNFPALYIANNPNITEETGFALPAITRNHSAWTAPGEPVYLIWESPGKAVGPNSSYITNTTAGEPKYVAWISQLNTTYTPLTITGENKGVTYQPGGEIYGKHTFSTYNGTIFAMVTDDNPMISPANISFLNQHVVAGPALYFSG